MKECQEEENEVFVSSFDIFLGGKTFPTNLFVDSASVSPMIAVGSQFFFFPAI
jgi:hypothetical protein